MSPLDNSPTYVWSGCECESTNNCSRAHWESWWEGRSIWVLWSVSPGAQIICRSVNRNLWAQIASENNKKQTELLFIHNWGSGPVKFVLPIVWDSHYRSYIEVMHIYLCTHISCSLYGEVHVIFCTCFPPSWNCPWWWFCFSTCFNDEYTSSKARVKSTQVERLTESDCRPFIKEYSHEQ